MFDQNSTSKLGQRSPAMGHYGSPAGGTWGAHGFVDPLLLCQDTQPVSAVFFRPVKR